jgi:hypothetical protein
MIYCIITPPFNFKGRRRRKGLKLNRRRRKSLKLYRRRRKCLKQIM